MYNRIDLDDPNVFANLKNFAEKNGIEPHSVTRYNPSFDFEKNDFCSYAIVTPEIKGLGMKDRNGLHSDALFTTNANHGLLLPVADCIAAVMYDPEHHVLGLAHLGRHSLEQFGGQKIIAFMQSSFGSRPEKIEIHLSPSVSQQSYPIWALDNKGMKEATLEQLQTAGILPQNIINNTAETDLGDRYYSYSQFLKGNRDADGDHAVVAVMKD